ncbi:MAG: hypothetical protein L0332_23650 [Chloroflexi bacterium]|nr:hypothetical protein [Chloroflexota bacterium]MCI0579467.1 hypothetical protein [Chloroflexota bacterium]MCI0644920.1 hypothetical protein [Chloroflexota bacterium]MCI0729688.1 hypothetical protein [Chloroflexota bacterium]
MSNELFNVIKAAAEAWAREYFQATEAVGYVVEEDEDEPGRFVVSLAMPDFDEWQAVEVWTEDNQVVSINWLGEGVPPDGIGWPWR